MRGRWTPPRGYITLSEVAALLGWSWKRAWRWGLKERVIIKIDGHWVTTKKRILLAFPDVAAEHLEHG